MATKRRLPVLNSPANAEAEEPPRPPWQWVGFGTLAIVVVWLPASFLTAVLVDRAGGLNANPVARALVFGLGLAVASLAGGFLVGRWGPSGVGVREGFLAGLAASLGAIALSFIAGGFSPGVLAIVVFAVPPAGLGASLGLKRRRPAW